MATQAELKRERELLEGFGLNPVRTWSARCKWYNNEDGSYYAELPSDMYSRLRYMERGLRPVRTLLEEVLAGEAKKLPDFKMARATVSFYGGE